MIYFIFILSATRLVVSQPPVCEDKTVTCPQYGRSVCAAPYDAWARQNCALYCGFCSGSTSLPKTTVTSAPEACVDRISNCDAYGQGICTNATLSAWASQNCRYFCRVCTSEQLAMADLHPYKADCKDKRSNCAEYGASICKDPYAKWGQEYCPLYCGFCTNCRDKRSNCADYGKNVCKEPYYKWGKEYCPQYCGFCAAGVVNATTSTYTGTTPAVTTVQMITTPMPTTTGRPSTTPRPTTVKTTQRPTTVKTTQRPTTVKVTTPIATMPTTSTPKPTTSTARPTTQGPKTTTAAPTTQRPSTSSVKPTPAPMRPTTTTPFPTTTTPATTTTSATTTVTPEPCVDKIKNCADYTTSVCTNQLYAGWVHQNCRYFCRNCTAEQLALVDSQTTTIEPSRCVDKVTNCYTYTRTVCSQYRTWAMENCMNYCNFCHGNGPTCVDTLSNCNQYGTDVCSKPEYHQWAIDNCRSFCQLCQSSTTAQP